MHVQVHYKQNFQIEIVRRTLAPHRPWFAVAVPPSAIVYWHFHFIYFFCSAILRVQRNNAFFMRQGGGERDTEHSAAVPEKRTNLCAHIRSGDEKKN